MLSVESVGSVDRAVGTGKEVGGPTGRAWKHLAWRAANTCLLGGRVTWPLEPDWVRTEELAMPLVNLGWELDGARLAHLSDLHAGLLVSESHLRRFVDRVNELQVDFVALTGDFVTTASRRCARMAARALGGLRANRGVLACLGNHDYGLWHPKGYGLRAGMADFLCDELAQAGVTVLRTATRAFFAGKAVVQFLGVEDYWSAQYDPRAAFDLVDYDAPVIALVHNPDGAPQLAALGAQWILAGHTHGNATPHTRFWDVVYPTRHKQFVGGRYGLGRGRNLYVNRGLGNKSRPRCDRLPEITLFTLRASARRTPADLAKASPARQVRLRVGLRSYASPRPAEALR
ncbi:MAG: metallophosphoesterase [Planctomycetota bacterium]|nr:metallophosphoesterase [Planctomycetota bacterium]